jgi:cytoskeletal protein RodZ
MSNLGATFRKARESAGLPLEKIASDTRISTRFLLAIESEAFDQLPGGIFNRGFIRSYAEYLGVDPEQALADYDRISTTAQEPLEVLRDVERDSSRRSERNLYPIAAAILVVSILAYYVVTRKPANTAEPPPQAVTAPQPEPTPEVSPAPPTEAPATTPTSVAQTQQAPVPAPAPTPPPAPSATLALAVDVNAKSDTWIKVTTDGAVVFADILPSGTERRFSAEHSINVTIGNAAGASLKINGRDLGQLGNEGRVREFRITPENAAKIQG